MAETVADEEALAVDEVAIEAAVVVSREVVAEEVEVIAEAVVEEEAHLGAVVHQEDVEELVPRVVRRPSLNLTGTQVSSSLEARKTCW